MKGIRMPNAVRPDGSCIRCNEPFGDTNRTCSYCGVHEDRRVVKKRRRKIGGKRGRNSGSTGSAKTKR